jgi:hypothetical protein
VPILGAGDLRQQAFQDTRELREPFVGHLAHRRLELPVALDRGKIAALQ